MVIRFATLLFAGAFAASGAPALDLWSAKSEIRSVEPSTNLKLTGLFGSVILPEANTVGTLAGTAAGVGGQFTFTEAAGTPLTIGAVDGTNGSCGMSYFVPCARTSHSPMTRSPSSSSATKRSRFQATHSPKSW